jgi:membrane protein
VKFADLFTLIREAALAFGQDKAPRLSAAIAYYAMFSIAPLLLFAVAVAGFFLTSETVITNLLGPDSTVAQSVGPDTAAFLRTLIPEPDSLQRGSALATTLGFVALFLGATGLFVQLQDALNSLWGADPAPPQGVLTLVRTRAVAFLLILGIGLILIAFLGLNTYLSVIARGLGDVIGAGAFFVRAGTFFLSIALLTPVFAAVYKFLPAVKLQWREVWVGSAVTATLFTLGQLLIGLYFGRAAPGSVFGAAASLVLLMLWIYYSAMIFFFGAEVTWVYSQKFGTRAGGAANVGKKEAVAAQGARIDPTPSAQEVEAAAQAGQPLRDARGRVLPGQRRRRRVLGVPLPRLPRRPADPTPSSPLPGLRATLWNALSAVLAVPAVLVLRLLGLRGKK